MNEDLHKKLFEPIKPHYFSKEVFDYSMLDYIAPLLDNMGDIFPHNSYIIDYYKKSFFFISKNSVLLCGYEHSYVMKSGYNHFSRILLEKDIPKLLDINEYGFKLYYKLSLEQKKEAYISYDLMLKHKNGNTFCVNHRLKPFLFAPDGNVWLAICTLRHSPNEKTGNVKVFLNGIAERYEFSFKTKNWRRLQEICFSDKERFVALETDKGTPEKIIAAELNCTRSNISYYKTQIVKKTNTRNIREAILHLYSNAII